MGSRGSRMGSEKMVLILYAVVILVFSSHGIEVGGRKISSLEEMELEREVNILNKPAIKTIQTEYGDIIDCVDINKQPAFDHPLLKDHKIELRSNFNLTKMIDRAPSTQKLSKMILKGVGCPSGTVPIQRTTKEDLKRGKFLTEEIRKRDEADLFHPLTADSHGYHFAMLQMSSPSKYHGADANINLYNPKVAANQFSSAQIWLNNGAGNTFNSIQAGWTVNPFLSRDNKTRLFGSWKGVGGCWNIQCPGFVQLSNEYYLGMVISPVSVYEGLQWEMRTFIFTDTESRSWKLMIGDDTLVGYWPKAIFTSLAENANAVHMGGQVYSSPNQVGPEMGSGHFPQENQGHLDRASGFRNIKLLDAATETITYPGQGEVRLYADKPQCYDVGENGDKTELNWGYTFFFGGPGGNCGI